jgi:hypothetical protein
MARRYRDGLAVFAALLILAALLPPLRSRAADHLDAPGLQPPGDEIQADINDLYVFEGGDPNATVIAATFHPVATAESSFGDDLLYELKVDTDGDAVEDHSFEFTFSSVRDNGAQFVIALHSEGEAAADGEANGDLIGFGQVGKQLTLAGDGMLFTGLRSDPFFFDLDGFRGTVEGVDNSRELNDGNENDFFAELDALAIVVEVPDSTFGGPIGVWATTSDSDGSQIDRMGRPAINTVVNSSGPIVGAPAGNKEAFNEAEPADDVANFTDAVVSALQALSATDTTEGAYTDCQADALAGVLLPDILAFDKAGTLPAPLNGRALDDDVIDTELRIVTGGDPLVLFGPGNAFCDGESARDADGGINTDGVDAHTDYQSEFPYLGEPHDTTYGVPELEGTLFSADLEGANEVPAVDTEASGRNALRIFGESLAHLTVAHNLESAVAAHIHVGDPGENGPVVTFLYGPTGGEDIDGILSMGSVGDDDLVAGTLDDLIDVLRGGFAYVNAHTEANPGGEIRGQVAPLNVGPAGARFTDDDGNTHEANIEIIAAADITRGCNPPDNDEFCPDRNITRGEMAAFLNRAFNLQPGPDAFVDDETSTFEGDINAIAAVGITRGCNPPTNDRFCPNDDLTRGEMAAFLNRAFGLGGGTDAFTDDDTSIFEGDINAIAAVGITKGCNPPTNDMYCPDRNLRRSEMASFIARAFGWGG